MSNNQDVQAFAECIYNIVQDLFRTGIDGKSEPDNDRISEITNSWVF